MSGIRTVIVTTPAMVRELFVRTARSRVHLNIVAELNIRRGLAQRLATLAPDLVIIGLRHNEGDRLIRGLLARLPRVRVIAFAANGRGAGGYELRLYQIDLSDASPARMMEFIRGCLIRNETAGDRI